MIRPSDAARAAILRGTLTKYRRDKCPLPGLAPAGHIDCLVAQLVDSLRRTEFIFKVRDKIHSPKRAVPGSGLFDPLRAAAMHSRAGNVDEAFWLVFIATHFGKHATDGWRLAEAVYGKLGQGELWDWPSTHSNLKDFRTWVAKNQSTLKGADGVSRRFSNHRKYESVAAGSKKGLPAVVESYVHWIAAARGHQTLIRQIHKEVGQEPREVFNAMYKHMDAVTRFGRLGKFDYLTMLGKLGIAPIEPGSAYLREATGPMAGARLLFLGNTGDKRQDNVMDNWLLQLDDALGVGMQALEDALCNWQKSPAKHIYFKG
jgi:Alpha-glutamyl/putrescinyl thymine pyrophosphorylase clade 3